MNNNELQNFLETLHLEYDDFEDECRQLTGKEMLDSITEKYTKFKIYDYLLANAKYYNYKHLKKNNILNYYYNQFIKTSYELSNDDLQDFMTDEMVKEKRRLNQSEM